MLTVGGIVDAPEIVTLHHALKSLALGYAGYIKPGIVVEVINRDDITRFPVFNKSLELNHLFLGGGIGFGKMSLFGLGGFFLLLVVEGQLYGSIPVRLNWVTVQGPA